MSGVYSDIAVTFYSNAHYGMDDLSVLQDTSKRNTENKNFITPKPSEGLTTARQQQPIYLRGQFQKHVGSDACNGSGSM